MLSALTFKAMEALSSVDPNQITDNTRRILKGYQVMGMVLSGGGTTPGGGTTTPDQAINKLGTMIQGIVVAIGVIMALCGVVQVGMSMAQHDPSQRMNGFLVLAGGLLVAIAPGVLTQLGITGFSSSGS